MWIWLDWLTDEASILGDPKATRNQVDSGRIQAAGAWRVGVGGGGGRGREEGRGRGDALLCPGTVTESAVLKQWIFTFTCGVPVAAGVSLYLLLPAPCIRLPVLKWGRPRVEVDVTVSQIHHAVQSAPPIWSTDRWHAGHCGHSTCRRAAAILPSGEVTLAPRSFTPWPDRLWNVIAWSASRFVFTYIRCFELFLLAWFCFSTLPSKSTSKGVN